MLRSADRILTTHVGSLPRPASLVAAYCDEPGSPKLAAVLKESVRDVVQKQLDCGIDVIDDNIELPELDIGDLIVGRMMGAYTWASATDFNFFRRAKVVVVNERPAAEGRVVKLQRRR